MSKRYHEGEEEYEGRRRRGDYILQEQGQELGSWSACAKSKIRITTSQEEEEEEMKGSEQHQSPHATICGKHPAIRIYHRKGKGKRRDQNESAADSSPNKGTQFLFSV